MIIYIDQNAKSVCDGSQENPYRSLTEFQYTEAINRLTREPSDGYEIRLKSQS